MSAKLEGIFTPTLVPLDDRGQINEAELRRFISWLIDRGVHGLYPNGSTGEFTRFNAEERRRIVGSSATKRAGRVPVLAGAAEANVQGDAGGLRGLCRDGRAGGGDRLAVLLPAVARIGLRLLRGDRAPLADRRHAVQHPDVREPDRRADHPPAGREFPRVVGIKDSSGDLAFMMRMIAAVRPMRPDFTFLTGWEAVLAPMLMVGCDGGTNASSNAVPEVTRRIYELCRAGKYEEAMKWQYRITGAVRHDAVPLRVPRRLPRRGRAARLSISAADACRRPPRSRPTATALAKVLQCILADFELVEPSGRRAARRAARSRPPTRWSRWCCEVMHELEKRGIF